MVLNKYWLILGSEILAHPWFGKNSYKNFLEKKVTPPITFDSVGRIDLDRH